MALKHVGYVDLPPHLAPGGFDHAAIHRASGRLFVAHTANDALDVIDCRTDRFLHSIPSLAEVAGALVTEERNLVFTSNRGENTVGIFAPDAEADLSKVPVGVRPNGLAYAPQDDILVVANVGAPGAPETQTVSIVDVSARRMIASIPMPGRTRWAVFDPSQGTFFVNISDPPVIVSIPARSPWHLENSYAVPAAGPHGLDLDMERGRPFCACDAKKLVCLDSRAGGAQGIADLSGPPDVVFFNAATRHLYVAGGDPGTIDVFDTQEMRLVHTLETEKGAHTIGFDGVGNKVYAFLPRTHRAAVYADEL